VRLDRRLFGWLSQFFRNQLELHQDELHRGLFWRVELFYIGSLYKLFVAVLLFYGIGFSFAEFFEKNGIFGNLALLSL